MSSSIASIRTLLCLIFAVSTAAPMGATSYYVDQSRGTDRATGKSPQTAWQHLSVVNRLIKERRLQPGDSVLLKSGERWREQIEISDAHGELSRPIRFASYGEGDYPTIDAADVATNWIPVNGAVYQASVSQDVYKVFVDGGDKPSAALVPVKNAMGDWQAGKQYQMWDKVQTSGKGFLALREPVDARHISPADWLRLPQADVAQQGDGLTNVTQTAGSWWYDEKGKRVLVHLADGSNPASHSIQIVTRRYGIHLQSSSNVVIEGLRIIHAAKSGIFAAVADVASQNSATDNQSNVIRNCIFWNIADTTTDFSTALNVGGEGAIYLAAGTGTGRVVLDGWTIKDNAIGTIDSSRGISYDRAGVLLSGTSGIALTNNYISTTNALGTSVITDRSPSCVTPSIRGNYYTNNDGNLRVSGCAQPIIDGNTIEYSYGYGIQVGGNSSGATVVRNSIHHIERLGQENAYNGIDCNGGAPGGTLEQNYISAVWGAEATFEVGCGHWTIQNNVFDSSNNMKGGGLTFYIRRESVPGLQFRNNTYHLNEGTTRQFNFGAGEPGAQTFHDITWWQQNIEPTAHTAPQVTVPASIRTALKTPAALNYLRSAPATKWEP